MQACFIGPQITLGRYFLIFEGCKNHLRAFGKVKRLDVGQMHRNVTLRGFDADGSGGCAATADLALCRGDHQHTFKAHSF